MLDYHKAHNADVTIAAMPVPMEEASRFGIVIADEDGRIQEFQEKPAEPKSNLASMGTLGSYWEANMELIDIIPEFNLYEEFWKIYTNSEILPPQYISAQSVIERSIICNGAEVYGEVHNSIIGSGVIIGEGSVIKDSIIMKDARIGKNCVVDKAIIAENCVVGDNVTFGIGSDVPNKLKPAIYSFGLVAVGEKSVIPDGVQIGKNTAVSGVTSKEDYPDGVLESGETLIKAGGQA